jgi:2-keto-myo-inositol isomerase
MSLTVRDFAVNTVALGGMLEEKLAAISDAGFDTIELAAKDLLTHPDGLAGGARVVRASGLRVSAFQALRDFEGMTGDLQEYKIGIAKSMLEMMHAAGAQLLIASSSTSAYATNDMEKIARDLVLLATLATPLGIRIAYEALSWGRAVNDYSAAWQAVERANRANVGLAIDAFHLLARGTPVAALAEIPIERIFLVQLSDYRTERALANPSPGETAGEERVFPGEGMHSSVIVALLQRMSNAGYRGDYTLGDVNDDYVRSAPSVVAARVRKSAEWLCEQVGRSSNDSVREGRVRTD